MSDWQPGDVVRLANGDVFGMMANGTLNPWVALSYTDPDEDPYFETFEIELESPVLIARDGKPVTGDQKVGSSNE